LFSGQRWETSSRKVKTGYNFGALCHASKVTVIAKLPALLRDLFANAVKADQKTRLRTLKNLDAAAMVLVNACAILVNEEAAVPGLAQYRERLEDAAYHVEAGRRSVRHPVR